MKLFKNGLSVGEMIVALRGCSATAPFLVASDEEQNTVFRGFFLEEYEGGVVVAGLTGCELEED